MRIRILLMFLVLFALELDSFAQDKGTNTTDTNIQRTETVEQKDMVKTDQDNKVKNVRNKENIEDANDDKEKSVTNRLGLIFGIIGMLAVVGVLFYIGGFKKFFGNNHNRSSQDSDAKLVLPITSESQQEEQKPQPSRETTVEKHPDDNTDTFANVGVQSESPSSDADNTSKPAPESIPVETQKSGIPEWVVVGASVKGNGHIQSNMPCQDSNKFVSLGDGWGIAIVSDGAGSAEHSDLGSKIVVERGVFHVNDLIEKEGWKEKGVLPSDIEWLQKSYQVLKTIRDDVEFVARKNKVELRSLAATCLVVVYSPIGLLAVHVGDGRMGYKSMDGTWKSMMTPHKGEEANQTVFLVSGFWSIPNCVISGVLVPESIVVREPVRAFALMSDGCENTAWQCVAMNPETGKYHDRNRPFEGFFNPLEETLETFGKEQVPEKERQTKWYKFIESGTKGFVKEQDDKTMIYALNLGISEEQ